MKILLLTLADMNIYDKEIYAKISENFNIMKLIDNLKEEDEYQMAYSQYFEEIISFVMDSNPKMVEDLETKRRNLFEEKWQELKSL